MPLSLDAAVAVLGERIDNSAHELHGRMDSIRIANSEFEARILQELGMLKTYQREQNGNVSKAMDRIGQLEARAGGHDSWHGSNDHALAARLAALEQDDHDAEVRRRFLAMQWKVLLSGIAIGGGTASMVSLILKILGVI